MPFLLIFFLRQSIATTRNKNKVALAKLLHMHTVARNASRCICYSITEHITESPWRIPLKAQRNIEYRSQYCLFFFFFNISLLFGKLSKLIIFFAFLSINLQLWAGLGFNSLPGQIRFSVSLQRMLAFFEIVLTFNFCIKSCTMYTLLFT